MFPVVIFYLLFKKLLTFFYLSKFKSHRKVFTKIKHESFKLKNNMNKQTKSKELLTVYFGKSKEILKHEIIQTHEATSGCCSSQKYSLYVFMLFKLECTLI